MAKRNQFSQAIRATQQFRSYDCGLGIYFTGPARTTYSRLPRELKGDFDGFLDSLFAPFPNIMNFRARQPGVHSYSDERLQVTYKVEKSPHPDMKVVVTVSQIKPA